MLNEKLLCVCNDNANCFQNQTLNALFNFPNEVGFCISAKRGYCYKSYYESTRAQGIHANGSQSTGVYRTISKNIDDYYKDSAYKYGCLHFSPFLFLMCSFGNSDGGNDKFFSCCKNASACNFYLNLSRPINLNMLSLSKRFKQSQERGYHLQESDFKFSRKQAIPISHGQEILMKAGSNSKSENFRSSIDLTTTQNHINYLQIVYFFVPTVIMIGIIVLLLLARYETGCIVSFPKNRRRCMHWTASNRLKLSLNPSSAASTNSTNLQDSQSFSSSHFARNKFLRGKLLINKLELLDFLSSNQHSECYAGLFFS